MSRTCVKCGFENTAAVVADTSGCPACGAIYAKAQPAVARHSGPASVPAGSSRFRATSGGADMQRAAFIDELRGESQYHATRAFAGLGYYLGVVLGVLLFLVGVVQLFSSSVVGGVLTIALAVAVVFISHVFRQGTLMVCDMADAMVRMAARREE